MKKKNAAMFFLRSLMKSVLVIASVLLVGVISYKVSYEVLSRRVEKGDVSKEEIEEILQEAKIDEISKNLIYVVDDKKNVTHMLLEICNTKTYNMDYITIPVKTDYTIPAKMYQKLCVVDEEIPQIVRLSKLRNYFSDLEDDKAYGYAELILEKLLDTEISYYTVITEEIYENHYKEEKQTTSYEKPAGSNSNSSASGSVTMNLSMVGDTYLNQLNAMNGDREKIVEFIKAQYAQELKVQSNLTVYNKIGYVEAYEKMNAEYYHYWGMPGSFSGKNFTIDGDSSSAFIQNLEENTTAYTEKQVFGKVSNKKSVSSKGKRIIVLNGSKITGLATSTQETLVNAGFTVPKVGDYTEETLTQTRIIVSKDGMGQDLITYFKNPEIVVGTVDDGYDIKIILGTVDAN